MKSVGQFINENITNYEYFSRNIEEIIIWSEIVRTLKKKRVELKISQRDLAANCKLPHSTIARFEAGKTKPNVFTLIKIARQLNLAVVLESFKRKD